MPEVLRCCASSMISSPREPRIFATISRRSLEAAPPLSLEIPKAVAISSRTAGTVEQSGVMVASQTLGLLAL